MIDANAAATLRTLAPTAEAVAVPPPVVTPPVVPPPVVTPPVVTPPVVTPAVVTAPAVVEAAAPAPNPMVCLPPAGAYVAYGQRANIIVCIPELARLIRANHSQASLAEVTAVLKPSHVSEVPLLPSHLVPAGEANPLAASFGYGAAWYRDTALIGLAYNDERSFQITQGLAHNALTDNQIHRFFTGIAHGHAAANPADMPQIKISADGTDLKGSWGHNQLDALGISLFTMLRYSHEGGDDGAITEQIRAGALITAYLDRIGYVRVPCNGHWEESGPGGQGAILTSSLGCVVHGLKAMARWVAKDPSRAKALDGYLRSLDGIDNGFGEKLHIVRADGALEFSFERGDHNAAIAEGIKTIRERHVNGEWLETFKDAMGRQRGSDLALTTFVILELQSPEEDRILTRDELTGLVAQLDRDLKGPIGYRRYANDGWLAAYHGADGPDPEPRAAIGKNIADRDAMNPGTSPEWTLGNGAMAHIYGRLYLETGNVRFRDKANEGLNRMLGNIGESRDADKHFMVTELFMKARVGDHYTYVPNGMNLSWSRAYVHMAVDTLSQVVTASAERASRSTAADGASAGSFTLAQRLAATS